MAEAWGHFVSRHRRWIVLGWIALLVGLRSIAPSWDSVTHDGDLAYLPAGTPSARGQQVLRKAFPRDRAKSQIVLMIAREAEPLRGDDTYLAAYDLARRFKTLHGRLSYERGRAAQAGGDAPRAAVAFEDAARSLDEALAFDAELRSYLQRREPTASPVRTQAQLSEAYRYRAWTYQALGQSDEARQLLAQLDPHEPAEDSTAQPLPLVDVWTWRDELFGSKLGRDEPHARLIVLQLANEFMATDNIRTLEYVEQQLEQVRANLPAAQLAGLELGLTGSAAVGGDMLRAARDCIRHTEWYTLVLVVAILAVVYRAPLLVIIPLVTIGVSLGVATSLIALLTRLSLVPGFGWWDLKVFTTSRIFIVVILFGAGTDYCLFLIARYREELGTRGEPQAAAARALSAVAVALLASALTTVVGLSMMWFADYGKYHYSGPVIGLCLTVTLLGCLTLAPALLALGGRTVFWPGRPSPQSDPPGANLQRGVWAWVARQILRFPATLLLLAAASLWPLAARGWSAPQRVTYDVFSELPAECPSRRGAELLKRHFPLGESGPLTVLVSRPDTDFNQPASRVRLRQLSDQLRLPGVQAVRSIEDPLGELKRANQTVGLFGGSRGMRLRVLRAHRRTRALFLAPNVARLELVLAADPFSITAERLLEQVDQRLESLRSDPYWSQASFSFSGVTAGIRDLKQVTRSDRKRIEVLVVAAVLLVLLALIQRPVLCLFMIATVLFSYYVTIGVSERVFAWAYGPDFHGLDWKVPLFLFVILVAVGQDYNVYLATRAIEEQRLRGPFGGLRYAVIQTGGIITSCGIIMAGTFVSMTSTTWSHLPGLQLLVRLLAAPGAGAAADQVALRGIVELGFALSFGVILDTFVVRAILLPAFMATCARCKQGRRWRNTRARRVSDAC